MNSSTVEISGRSALFLISFVGLDEQPAPLAVARPPARLGRDGAQEPAQPSPPTQRAPPIGSTVRCRPSTTPSSDWWSAATPTVTDAPCDAGICIELDGQFRGTPVGTGAYTGSIKLKVAEGFPNGEGGVCAPIKGRTVLGAGTPDRLVLAITGDSCQDGAGDPTTSSFTGLAQFTVKRGTGKYAGSTGSGLASFLEDAADNDRMTLIGRISG